MLCASETIFLNILWRSHPLKKKMGSLTSSGETISVFSFMTNQCLDLPARRLRAFDWLRALLIPPIRDVVPAAEWE
jgi:hypothetical protein